MPLTSVSDSPTPAEPTAAASMVRSREESDDAADIRYSLTALGEALVAERARSRFRGFGPCPVAKIAG